MNPKISIILPTYNGASKYLRQSIDSCLNQTYQNIELIIVDDCSKDNTSDVIQSYHDPRIIYIRNKTNQRLPRSLNIGFAASTGDYLTWTSDDNEFTPSAIEDMLKFLQKYPQTDFVYTDMIVRYFETKEEEPRKFSDLNLEKENNVGACYLYSRKVYESTGEYDPRFEWVEDYDYWIRIAKKFQVRHYPKALYIYGDHRQSLTSTRRYPIVMMRDILRYWHGYLTRAEFLETIRQFSVDVRTHIQGKDKQVEAFKQVFKKAFGISFSFGVYFATLFAILSLRMFLNILLRPIKQKFQHISDLHTFKTTMASLKLDNQKVNVLCIIPELVVGGSEKVIWDVVNGLKANGYDFHLICNRKQDNEWCRKFTSSFQNVILLKEFAEDVQYNLYLPELIKKLNVKILMNTNSRVGYRCLPALKTECSQLKTLDIIHLEDVGGAIEKYAWAAQHINQRVCISHHLKEYMRGVYLRENISAQLNERIEVIHNGTQHIEAAHAQTIKGQFRKKHSIAPDEIIITFVGRMAPEKKPFLFIDIARLLINKSPMTTFKFVMAGGGPYVSKIQNRIKECGMQDQFILPGMMDDITPLLADTFLLYVVSRHEGIPLVIQEAQAMNIPVISTNVGAIRELISDGVNGYLINLDENTAENFADKTMALLSDRQKYESMVASSKTALFPEFSMERMLTRYKEIFHKLLLEKK